MLTAAAYGVDQFLFVYGDKPSSGGRTGELTVRAMIEEARDLPGDPAFAGVSPFRVGVAAALRPLPHWKRAADFIFAQVSFSVEALLRWRAAGLACRCAACRRHRHLGTRAGRHGVAETGHDGYLVRGYRGAARPGGSPARWRVPGAGRCCGARL
jgi:hypothetical protein